MILLSIGSLLVPLSPLVFGNSSGIQLPEGCPSNAFPTEINSGGSTYIGCNIYSPEQRAQKSALEDDLTHRLMSARMMPSPVIWVMYDPLRSSFDMALTRNLTGNELATVQTLIPGSFNAEILKIQLTAVCDTFTSPPTGVCDTAHNGGGSLGWRAKQYVCRWVCYWIYGGTTWSHGSMAYGDTVFQPDATRAYGTVRGTACANGVDASWFVLNAGQSEMNPSMYTVGPNFGDYSGTPPAGTVMAMIGRGSGSVGYFAFLDAETANTCGTQGTSWFATYLSGAQSHGGDSGAGVGVSVLIQGVRGVEAAGIEWGITQRGGQQAIIFSPWSAVQSALGIQSY